MINRSTMEQIEALAREAGVLDSMFVKAGKSTHFIEILSRHDGPITMSANAEGLVHLAKVCLSLAAMHSEGSHHHFDEAGMVDKCDRDLVIRYKPAPWDT